MPRQIYINENGLSLFNQKKLDAELRRIDLEKHQYATNHQHEKRKVITKFARKLMLTNLHSNYENDLKEPEAPMVEAPAVNNKKKNRNMISEMDDDYGQLNSNGSSRRMSFDDANDYNFHRADTDIKSIEKGAFSREISNISHTGQNVLLPRVVHAQRNGTSTGIPLMSTKLPDIFNEQTKQSNRKSRKFMNSLNDENSGFYQLTNSKGIPLCDGYDNYGALLKSTPNIPYRFESGQEVDNKSFKNPFELEDQPQTSRKVDFDENEEVFESNTEIDFKRKIVTPNKPKRANLKLSSAAIFKNALQNQKNREEDKICKETFKAQNIRSLTMREVDIY